MPKQRSDPDEEGAPPLVLRDLRTDPNPGTGRPATSGTTYGNGMGWGGPPRGSGGDKPADGRKTWPRVMPPVSEADGELVDEAKATLIAAMREHTVGLLGISAAEKLMNRILGTPVATNLHVRADEYDNLTPAEIAAERARIGAALTHAGPAGTEDGLPEPPEDVVH